MKSVRFLGFSDPYFLAFGLNTERYSVSLCLSFSIRMQEYTSQKNSENGRRSSSVFIGNIELAQQHSTNVCKIAKFICNKNVCFDQHSQTREKHLGSQI